MSRCRGLLVPGGRGPAGGTPGSGSAHALGRQGAAPVQAAAARPGRYEGPLFDGHVHACGPLADAGRLLATLDGQAGERRIDRAVLLASPIRGAGARHVPWLYLRTVGTWQVGKLVSWRLLGSPWFRRSGRAEPDNALVARLLAVAPGRLVGFAFVDPCGPDPVAAARRWVEGADFRGLKLHGWFHRTSLQAPGVQQLAAYAARDRLPILLHPSLVPDLERSLDELARLHPDTAFIVAHLHEDGVEVAARRDNVFLDTAGLTMTPRRLRRVLQRAGAGKLIFGSDSPRETGGNLSYSLRLLESVRLPVRELESICWGRLNELLGRAGSARSRPTAA